MRVSPRLKRWLGGAGADPSVRLRYWLEIEGRSLQDAPVRSARRALGREGWAASLLAHQWPNGSWVTPGTEPTDLYLPKYIVTNWMAIVLADLGMTRSDPRIRRTAELILDRWSRRGEPLSGQDREVCVMGNAVRTLVRFGYLDHPAVRASIDQIVRTQKSDGGWHCWRSRTGTLDGWEGLAALVEIPEGKREPSVRRAIERGIEFYLDRRLMNEGPARYPPWFRIHYPNHYYYDVLVGLRILSRAGPRRDRRLGPALRWLKQRRAADGTWAIDAPHPDLDPKLGGYSMRRIVFPVMLEPLHEPSRWATVEALSVLARLSA